MKKRSLIVLTAMLVAGLLPGGFAPALAGGMDLAGQLVKDLGVTQSQAEGGAGSIFKVAQNALSAEDFSKVTSAVPEASKLMQAAPKADAAQAVSSALGNKAGSAGNLAALAGSFSKLGLKGDMVGKFIPIVLNYSKSKGGAGVFSLLQSVLK